MNLAKTKKLAKAGVAALYRHRENLLTEKDDEMVKEVDGEGSVSLWVPANLNATAARIFPYWG